MSLSGATAIDKRVFTVLESGVKAKAGTVSGRTLPLGAFPHGHSVILEETA